MASNWSFPLVQRLWAHAQAAQSLIPGLFNDTPQTRFEDMEDQQIINGLLLDELPDREEHLVQQQPLRIFDRFSDLPIEIRRMIWRESFLPREIIFPATGKYGVGPYGPPFATVPSSWFGSPQSLTGDPEALSGALMTFQGFELPVSARSNLVAFVEALLCYQLIYQTPPNAQLSDISFWPERDTAVLSCFTLELNSQCDESNPIRGDLSGLRNVQRVKVVSPWWPDALSNIIRRPHPPKPDDVPRWLLSFRALESLREVQLCFPHLCISYDVVDNLHAAFRKMRDDAHPNSPLPLITFYAPRPGPYIVYHRF